MNLKKDNCSSNQKNVIKLVTTQYVIPFILPPAEISIGAPNWFDLVKNTQIHLAKHSKRVLGVGEGNEEMKRLH
jgi:hypothetical protein